MKRYLSLLSIFAFTGIHLMQAGGDPAAIALKKLRDDLTKAEQNIAAMGADNPAKTFSPAEIRQFQDTQKNLQDALNVYLKAAGANALPGPQKRTNAVITTLNDAQKRAAGGPAPAQAAEQALGAFRVSAKRVEELIAKTNAKAAPTFTAGVLKEFESAQNEIEKAIKAYKDAGGTAAGPLGRADEIIKTLKDAIQRSKAPAVDITKLKQDIATAKTDMDNKFNTWHTTATPANKAAIRAPIDKLVGLIATAKTVQAQDPKLAGVILSATKDIALVLKRLGAPAGEVGSDGYAWIDAHKNAYNKLF